MPPFPLDPGGRRLPLERGYALRAPGLAGEGALFFPTPGSAPVRAAAPATPELEEAFRRTDFREAVTLALDARPTPPPPTVPALRSPEGEDALELEVPDLGPDRGQVVLAIAEDGALSWHFPVDPGGTGIEAPTVRGSGGVRRFRIPREVVPPPSDPATHRGFVGTVGRKLLKVLVYPAMDPVLGTIGRHFAGRWEARNRPYRIREFLPDTYTLPEAPELAGSDWERLARGRALLFIHGTFSTSWGAFQQIPRALMEELHREYQGRVIAFDTYTLSQDPAENARWFLDQIPEGLRLEADVICHSRGGLVARGLGLLGSEGLRTGGRVGLRRVVFVGVPNGGTVLADPAHMVQILDRMSSAMVLLPSGPVTEVMEAVLVAVKVLGHGVVNGLPGLASMHPDGPFLQRLNGAPPGGAEGYAVTADFEPIRKGLRSLLTGGAAGALADRIFQGEPNDLVVSTEGVHSAGNAGDFPLPPERVLRFPPEEGVVHTSYFGAPETSEALRRWLIHGRGP